MSLDLTVNPFFVDVFPHRILFNHNIQAIADCLVRLHELEALSNNLMNQINLLFDVPDISRIENPQYIIELCNSHGRYY